VRTYVHIGSVQFSWGNYRVITVSVWRTLVFCAVSKRTEFNFRQLRFRVNVVVKMFRFSTLIFKFVSPYAQILRVFSPTFNAQL